MALQAETPARTRLATYSKNHCPQCGEWLLAPDWSEYHNDRCVRHTWSCRHLRLSIRDDGILRGARSLISLRAGIGVAHALEVGDGRSICAQIGRSDRRLAVAAGNV